MASLCVLSYSHIVSVWWMTLTLGEVVTSKLECDVLTLCSRVWRPGLKVSDKNCVVGSLHADRVFTGSQGTICKEKRLGGWPLTMTLAVS